MAKLQLSLLAVFSICLLSTSGVFSQTTFTITNQCTYPVWPALQSNPGAPQPPVTGFLLNPSFNMVVPIPASWSGNLWARTRCFTDATGQFHCETGDCGTGSVECNGAGGGPPTTLFQISVGSGGGLDTYSVSVVTGFNTPMWVVPFGTNGIRCDIVGCTTDINSECPEALSLVDNTGATVACQSACTAFGDPRDCCTGAYSTPATCGPTSYTEFFKNACSSAVTYAFDGGDSTCAAATYTITFCPS